MKKIFAFAIAALTIALCLVPAALAETDCEARICQLATANEKVTKAKCVVYQRTAVVAIKTEKFTSRSQFDKYVKELTENIKSECEVDHVFVSRNPKVMQQIEELSNLDEQQREEAIRQIIEEVMRFQPIRRIEFRKFAAQT